ncbi:MAG: hypothetical protein DRP93_07730 [Candidatus Neomarinimicrobiota bacterium]|nr:MAG: hypothetical protein DRP93_07730 [Candidatus Neomarinimicrobiota bacterium]
MKKLLLIFLIALIALTSCEKVIGIDLNLAAPTLVIEGKVLKDSLAQVLIQKTTSYFSPDTQQCVCDAVVIIQEDDTRPDTLEYTDEGMYISGSMRGKSDANYHLTVIYDSQTYTASSYLPPEPHIYQLTAISIPAFGGFDDSTGFHPGAQMDTIPYLLFIDIYDDPNEENYYLFNYILNGEDITAGFASSDDESAENDTLNFMGMFSRFYLGDTVEVKAYAVDRGVYIYFKTLSDIFNSNPIMSSTPYNPHSNISNGALGVFSAMSKDSKTTIILPQVPGMP